MELTKIREECNRVEGTDDPTGMSNETKETASQTSNFMQKAKGSWNSEADFCSVVCF